MLSSLAGIFLSARPTDSPTGSQGALDHVAEQITQNDTGKIPVRQQVDTRINSIKLSSDSQFSDRIETLLRINPGMDRNQFEREVPGAIENSGRLRLGPYEHQYTFATSNFASEFGELYQFSSVGYEMGSVTFMSSEPDDVISCTVELIEQLSEINELRSLSWCQDDNGWFEFRFVACVSGFSINGYITNDKEGIGPEFSLGGVVAAQSCDIPAPWRNVDCNFQAIASVDELRSRLKLVGGMSD
jgi:hypothetical protein